MPTGMVKNAAKEHGISVAQAEAIWEKAKVAASESLKKSSPRYFATVTTIFKSMIKNK